MNRVLVANRGEVAVRIVRACLDLGLEVVVAHSEADRDGLAVRLATGGFCIGPGPVAQSYRNIPALLYAAARVGADAVHPGYGFLAEDPVFAAACEDVGLTFIGPTAQTIGMMGDKIGARALMAESGVPILPGSPGALRDVREAHAVADAVGYPVILKAAAGGGGRGIAVVPSSAGLDAAWSEIAATSRSLFGDARVFLERYVEAGRHVEVQVLGDGTDVTHLGERDCSVQRRHQKLVEESPAPNLPGRTVELLREAAERGARSIGYRSAGTFEFVVDRAGAPYFIEMNTRLQVEHPVTELCWDVDLVAAMIDIARGGRLPARAPAPRGWCMEARVVAEDPARGWLPSAGPVGRVHLPGGHGVRVDSHLQSNSVMSPLYDSLLAKVIAWGSTREQARTRLLRAVREVEVEGITTNTGFLAAVLASPEFAAGTHDVDLAGRLSAQLSGELATARLATTTPSTPTT